MRGNRPFYFALVLVVVDQISKVLVKGFSLFGLHHEGMQLGESHPILGETVRLTFVENPGMAFGISWGDGKIILTILTILIAVFIVRYLYSIRNQHWAPVLSITLILAGAVGNLVDRLFYGVFYGESKLFYGKVVDFVQVDIPDISFLGEYYTHWPVFNVADSCVSVGIVMLVFVGHLLPHNKIMKTKDHPLELQDGPGDE